MSDLAGLVQPDARSCGAACLVAARAWQEPTYARSLRADPSAWAGEVLRTHREVTRLRDGGRTAPPWPRALGTPPWAVARRLQARSAARWQVRWLRVGDRAASVAALRRAVADGRTVPLYVGSRWLPRHVVLVVDARAGAWHVYDPSRGRVVSVPEDDLRRGDVPDLGWPVLWCAVLPG